MRHLLALCLLPFVLSGCALLVLGAIGETGISVAEERSLGTKIDDYGIYAAVHDQFVKSEHDGLTIDATVNVRAGRVMLTGNMKSAEMAQQAVAAAQRAKGVKEVIDELIINPDATYTAAANDLLVKKNLVARLIIAKDVWNINYSTDVVAGTAYLLGLTKTQAEMDKVLHIARTTKGVKRVVNHLQIGDPSISSRAAPTPVVTESPIAPATAPLPPTDGTISTEPVDSDDIAAPSSTPASTPVWR